MKTKHFLSIAMFVIVLIAKNSIAEEIKPYGLGGNYLNCPQHYVAGEPKLIGYEADKIMSRSFFVCRTAYALQYDPQKKTPIWVSEELTYKESQIKTAKRKNNFAEDYSLPSNDRAKLEDYKYSGFDRGHLAPAGDMVEIINSNNLIQDEINKKAMDESFILSNIVPQVGKNNNQDIWEEIESLIRFWVKKHGNLSVITGPIYDGEYSYLGNSRIAIPTHLYKVVLDKNNMESIAFIVPNKQVIIKDTKKLEDGNDLFPQTTKENAIDCNKRYCEIKDFVVPIKDVEMKTGLLFFNNIENKKDLRRKVIK